MKNISKKPGARCDGEPALADLLDDPVLHVLMARDHVDRADLQALIQVAQQHLAVRKVSAAGCCA